MANAETPDDTVTTLPADNTAVVADEDDSPFAPRSAPAFDRTPKATITISPPGAALPTDAPPDAGSILQRMKARRAAESKAKAESAATTEASANKPKSKALRVIVKSTLGLAVTGAMATGAWYTQDYWWIPSVESMATLPADKRAKIHTACEAEVKALPAPLHSKLTKAHDAVQRTLRFGPPDQAAYAQARDAVRAAETEASPELGRKCRNYREYLRLAGEQNQQKWLTAAAPLWDAALQQLVQAKMAHEAQVAAFGQETAPMAFNAHVNAVLMGVQKEIKVSELQDLARFETNAVPQLTSFFRYGGGVSAVQQSEIYPVDPAAKTVFVPMADCADAKTNVSARKPLSDCAATDKPTLAEIIEVIPAKKLSVWLVSAHGWTVDGKPTRKGKGVVNVELAAAANLVERDTDWSLTVPLSSQNRTPDEMPVMQVEGRPEVKVF